MLVMKIASTTSLPFSTRPLQAVAQQHHGVVTQALPGCWQGRELQLCESTHCGKWGPHIAAVCAHTVRLWLSLPLELGPQRPWIVFHTPP